MAFVRVRICAPNGRQYHAEIENDANPEVILNGLVRHLDLPTRAENGEAIHYHLNLLNVQEIREGATIVITGDDSPHLSQPDDSAAQDTTHERHHLRIFLCHASEDKPSVRQLYHRLSAQGFAPWLDEENVLPGQEWEIEIQNAVRESHVVVVCLSEQSVSKEGYLQKEIRQILDVADEKPEGTIFVIPVKLQECKVPNRLQRWQYVERLDDAGFAKLIRSLDTRASQIKDASMARRSRMGGEQVIVKSRS
jgi:hypothetical protein